MNKKLKKLLLLIVILLFGAATYLLFRFMMLYTLSRFNNTVATQEAQSVLTAFSRRTESIENLNRDWSNWDDSYKFVQDLNQFYIDSNLSDGSLQSSNINLMLYFDNTGYIVYKKAASFGGVGDTTIPGEVFNYTSATNRIDIKDIIESGEQKSGFLHTASGTFVYAVSPILTSSGEGPANGALMMARYINNTDIEELRKATGLDLDIMDPSEAQRFYKIAAIEHLEKGPAILGDRSFLSVFVLAKDNWGTPANVILIRHKILGIEEGLNLVLAMTLVSTILLAIFSTYVPKLLCQNLSSSSKNAK